MLTNQKLCIAALVATMGVGIGATKCRADETAVAEGEVLACSGTLKSDTGEDLGSARIGLVIDEDSGSIFVSGEPLFQNVQAEGRWAPHQIYFRLPGWGLYLSRTDLSFSYEAEGRLLVGRCARSWVLL